MKSIIVISIALMIINGCALHNQHVMNVLEFHPRISISSFDGTKQAEQPLIWFGEKGFSGEVAGLGFWKNNKMDKNELIMKLAVPGAKIIKEAHFKINGIQYDFSPMDRFTDYEADEIELISSMRFETTIDFLETIINAANVAIKIDSNKTYVDGNLYWNPFTKKAVRQALQKFYEFCGEIY